MMRLGVLGSTRGTHLITLMEAIKEKKLSAAIHVVISNKQDALILERAKSYDLPSQFLDPAGLSCEIYDHKVSQTLQHYTVDLVVLIGYMRILSSEFVKHWENKIINVHPSLLPAFAGKMDLDVHRAVLQAGMKETGCTVHYVTEKVDSGPIILQRQCEVLTTDTPEILKQRVQQLESRALIEALNLICKDLDLM